MISHAVAKEAEHLRVQELVKKIENHPHRRSTSKPTCSSMTSTTHSATIRRRWFVNWVMWSCSSCAKPYQYYNALIVFLYWNQGIVYCICGQFLIDSESRRKLNKLRLDALSIPNYVIKKGPTHGSRHGKTEVQKSTIWLGMRGRDAVRKSTLKVNIWQVFTIDFFRDPVYHESQLACRDAQNQRCKELDELGKKKTIHIVSLQRTRKDTKNNGILLFTKQAKMGLWNSDLILEPLSRWKIVYTTNQENKLKSVSIQIKKDDGIHLQAHRCGTSLDGIGSELIRF